MRPAGHFTVAATTSLGLLALTGSWKTAVLSWVGGFLIDGDHVLDYWILHRRFDRYATMAKVFHHRQIPRAFVILHGFEWILFGVGLGWWSGRMDLVLPFLVGYSQHLAIDQFTNRLHPLFYFITFRAVHRFQAAPLGIKPPRPS